MAVFTALEGGDAERIASAHGLGSLHAVVPIAAGSVNSNFFLDTDRGRFFARIYEEQDEDGVAYEWALLDHLCARGVPAPKRIAGPGPGELRVGGKPTAVFERAIGEHSCQRGVTTARAASVGTLLGEAHRATRDFGLRRGGRFQRGDIAERLDAIATDDPEIARAVDRLKRRLAELDRELPASPASGVIHGDLFRDNVFFDGDQITCAIDWESASDGALGYDLMVAVLAWSYGDAFDFAIARAMVGAYDAVCPLDRSDKDALRSLGVLAAVRFATTRITDYALRVGIGERVVKDYRRFLARMDALDACSELTERLFG